MRPLKMAVRAGGQGRAIAFQIYADLLDEKLPEAAGGVCDVGFEKSLEFEERLFVEDYIVEVFCADACFFEAVVNGVDGEVGVVLFPGEAFFLCSGDDVAVGDECCGTVMVKCRNTYNVHSTVLFNAIACTGCRVIDPIIYRTNRGDC